MRIRSARLSDGPSVANFWRELLTEQHTVDSRFDASEDATERWLNDFRAWVEAPDVRHIVVAELSEELDSESGADLVGFASAQLWWPAPVYEQILEVYLDEIYVVPEHRKEGIGSRLLDGVKDWARSKDVTRIRLGTLAANEEAISFWKNRGASEFLVAMLLET